jgi:hypothetical protein
VRLREGLATALGVVAVLAIVGIGLGAFLGVLLAWAVGRL